MALIGNIDIIGIRENGTKDVTVTFPENLREDDPNYENRGETVTIQEPVYEQFVEETLEDVYVIVRMAAIHLSDSDRFTFDDEGNEIEIDTPRGETKQGYYVVYRYNVYESKEDRQDKFFSPTKELDNVEMLFVDNLDLGGLNLIEFCYDNLKTKTGFENLIND